ncbi:NAD(P)H-dependent oxidoreductase subunit E [Marispirochaeta sp.]|jgi:NADH:ubiquinone oxidoreductase subunit E|uniref:NAD(P)H-dependent oxidoreductase subunit E n=1 Tax=Marispirochaeta sp. TaxID=2038653 RepID=UPI0029C6537F|nr:NAD(P)H-dependent oxidoreductase subunit E [Marispirochaeta sp.]
MKDCVVVKICTGTACYVQGGSFLLDLENKLSIQERNAVRIQGVGCLGCCGDSSGSRPPFAMVDDTLVGGVDVDELAQIVKRKLHDTTDTR